MLGHPGLMSRNVGAYLSPRQDALMKAISERKKRLCFFLITVPEALHLMVGFQQCF
jgi:hypothetical protein